MYSFKFTFVRTFCMSPTIRFHLDVHLFSLSLLIVYNIIIFFV